MHYDYKQERWTILKEISWCDKGYLDKEDLVVFYHLSYENWKNKHFILLHMWPKTFSTLSLTISVINAALLLFWTMPPSVFRIFFFFFFEMPNVVLLHFFVLGTIKSNGNKITFETNFWVMSQYRRLCLICECMSFSTLL